MTLPTPLKRPRCRAARALLVLLALCALLAGVRLALAPYRVAGLSMAPALAAGELLLVDRYSWRLDGLGRGDVVVIRRGSGILVKRVVALPGETVEVRGGAVWVDGVLLPEPYLAAGERTTCGGAFVCQAVVPAAHVYLLGDNRDHSADSRAFGPVPLSALVGEAHVFP